MAKPCSLFGTPISSEWVSTEVSSLNPGPRARFNNPRTWGSAVPWSPRELGTTCSSHHVTPEGPGEPRVELLIWVDTVGCKEGPVQAPVLEEIPDSLRHLLVEASSWG